MADTHPSSPDRKRRGGAPTAGKLPPNAKVFGPAAPRLSLQVPQPDARPGDKPDFSWLEIPPARSAPQPPIDVKASTIRDLAFDLIRVLDEGGRAVGPWDPRLSAAALKQGLRTMVRTRAFDDRMFKMQRQGKTSFYIKCTGEEAVATGAAMALRDDDMCFTTYRQQALLLHRGYPLQSMVNQIYANAADPLQGRQLPVLYSAKSRGFFALSGNLATQVPQAVGWAMASAYKGDTRIAAAWTGDGATAEGDFQQALTFASVYRAPVVLTVVNNQWAISSFSGLAAGRDATFASRGIGYGLPSLRVDGNDLLAVYAATRWAAERARSNLGATLIELVTYRAAAHSTSDDPARYRPAGEAAHWPLGDPIERLKTHLITLGQWSEPDHEALRAQAEAEVRAAVKAADTLRAQGGSTPPKGEMFEHIFAQPDWRILEQRGQLGL